MPTNPVITPVDANGNVIGAAAGTAGAPAPGVVTVQGIAGGTAVPVAAASTVTSDLTYPSGAQALSNAGTSFSTATDASLAVDINLASFTGGTSPSVTFFVDRFGADSTWYRVWTSAAITAAGPVSESIGPGMSGTNAISAVLTGTCRFGWSTAGAPTGITFSASVVGR